MTYSYIKVILYVIMIQGKRLSRHYSKGELKKVAPSLLLVSISSLINVYSCLALKSYIFPSDPMKKVVIQVTDKYP